MSDQTECHHVLSLVGYNGGAQCDLCEKTWDVDAMLHAAEIGLNGLAELEAAQAREEALLGLLRQGRAILSNDANVKIQGDLIGQVIFGDWSAKVDAALAASEPPGTAEGEEGT